VLGSVVVSAAGMRMVQRRLAAGCARAIMGLRPGENQEQVLSLHGLRKPARCRASLRTSEVVPPHHAIERAACDTETTRREAHVAGRLEQRVAPPRPRCPRGRRCRSAAPPAPECSSSRRGCGETLAAGARARCSRCRSRGSGSHRAPSATRARCPARSTARSPRARAQRGAERARLHACARARPANARRAPLDPSSHAAKAGRSPLLSGGSKGLGET
jgi:hypothetical protein